MLCLSGFELYSRWVPLTYRPAEGQGSVHAQCGLKNAPYVVCFLSSGKKVVLDVY